MNKALKVHGVMVSPYTARVFLALGLKGLDYQALAPADMRSSEYLAMNPMGKMPVLDDNGLLLAESEVINEYLEETYPQVPLLPADPEGRARVRTLDRITDLYTMDVSLSIYRAMFRKEKDPGVIQPILDDSVRILSLYEHYLGEGPFAWQAQPTLADCALLPVLKCFADGFAGLDRADLWQNARKCSALWDHLGSHELTAGFVEEFSQALYDFAKARLSPS